MSLLQDRINDTTKGAGNFLHIKQSFQEGLQRVEKRPSSVISCPSKEIRQSHTSKGKEVLKIVSVHMEVLCSIG
jgi:hypothetical protein